MRPSPVLVVLSALLALAASGCRFGAPPVEPGSGGRGGVGQPASGDPSGLPVFASEGPGGEFVQEILYFLGADRPPARALAKIRDVHDLADWSHKISIADAAEQCREAVLDLGRSDHPTWDDLAISVWVLSTMAQRDPAALVRNDCVTTLATIGEWVRPAAAKMGAGVATTDQAVADALKTLIESHPDRTPHATEAGRLDCLNAIAVLGSYPWDRVEDPSPAVLRALSPRPRGVVRALTAPALDADRADPRHRDVLDRAIVRVTDEVIFLSLAGALADSASTVRASAAAALERLSERRAVDTLAYALARESHDVAALSIVGALGALAPRSGPATERALSALADRLGDPDPSLRRAAARAMARVTGEDPGPTPTDWQRWWRNRSSAEALGERSGGSGR